MDQIEFETEVSLENTVSGILEDDKSEYKAPVTNVVEELSIDTSSSEKLSSTVAKSNDCEKLSEIVEQAESYQQSANKETIKVPITLVMEELSISGPDSEKLSSQSDAKELSEVLEQADSCPKTADETIAVPITALVEKLSINSYEKLSSPSEKFNDSEELSEVVEQAVSCQKSNDNEENISTSKSKERLVIHHQKKYSVGSLKLLRDLPECKKLLKVNISNGLYSDCNQRPSILSSEQNKAKNIPLPSIHINSSLYCSKDAQIPAESILKSKNSLDEKGTHQNLYKCVTRILNELISNPEKSMEKMKNLPIDDASKLQGVIDLIHDTAVNDPDNCGQFAEMVRVMQNLNKDIGKMQMFRILLINKCQQHFERYKAEELDVMKKQEEIDACTDLEKKKELQLLFEETERVVRRKSVGNIRFIGELFKLQMLTAKIMLRCIAKLLRSTDEESLECLCKLLTTIGKDLESKLPFAQKKELELYFEKMQELSENDKYKVSSRIRFMLQDVINMRKNNKWEDLYESLANILTELTPEKIVLLVKRIEKLPINVSRLKGVIELVYGKAIDDPGNCQCCAKMCHALQHLNAKDEETGEVHTFRVLLINKCQAEFDREIIKELDVIEKQKEIDVCTDTVMKKKLQSILEKNVSEFHRKAVGNSRFIGELFKEQVLTADIVLGCITKLLENAEEESLECLCKLLTTIGKDLESKVPEPQKKELESHFRKMQELSKSKYKVLSRIRFMLQDVINLRKNDWVSSHQVDNSTTTSAGVPLVAPKPLSVVTASLFKSQISRTNYKHLAAANIYFNPPTVPHNRNNRGIPRWSSTTSSLRPVNRTPMYGSVLRPTVKAPIKERNRIKIVNPDTGEDIFNLRSNNGAGDSSTGDHEYHIE